MKICFVVGEIFAHGKYGGFGSLTRTLGRELVKRGIKVFVVTPQRGSQEPTETLDGMTIVTYPKSNWYKSRECFRAVDCDIYHSQEPHMGTYFAQQSMPDRIHLVTFQDPREHHDWKIEFKYMPLSQKLYYPVARAFEMNPLVHKAVRACACCYVQAKFVAKKAAALYGLDYIPSFLPNPVSVPTHPIRKSEKPLVAFLARWDLRKRIWMFFELANQFPNVEFIALGKATDPSVDARLRNQCQGIKNLSAPGFIDQFSTHKLSTYLEQSWILCNTAARECLPVSFLEAAAHQCAILSYVNPDNFSSHCGYHAQTEDFAIGLRWLLENNNWRERGLLGYEYVRKNHELDNVVDLHIAEYEKHIKRL